MSSRRGVCVCGGTLRMTETLVGGSTRGVFGGVGARGKVIFSDFGKTDSPAGAIGGLLYSFRSARVSTCPRLP